MLTLLNKFNLYGTQIIVSGSFLGTQGSLCSFQSELCCPEHHRDIS